MKLMASADADPLSLYRATEGNEANEFKRTASRLVEMRTQDYLAQPHDSGRGDGAGDLGGLVDG